MQTGHPEEQPAATNTTASVHHPAAELAWLLEHIARELRGDEPTIVECDVDGCTFWADSQLGLREHRDWQHAEPVEIDAELNIELARGTCTRLEQLRAEREQREREERYRRFLETFYEAA
jgi:hypothetical protein